MGHRHFLLNKPWGVLSQFVSNQPTRRNKRLLGELYDFPAGTMAVGRLDQDSEGLLLLTTDGKLSARVTGRRVAKEYYVQVDGSIAPAALARLQRGVRITVEGQPYETLPGAARMLPPAPVPFPRGKPVRDARHGPTSWVAVTIQEGKNRQVRKMTAAVGHPTLRLVRWRIGHLELADLPPGGVREVSEAWISGKIG